MKLLKNEKSRYSVIKKLYELRTKEERRREKYIYLAFAGSFIPMLVITILNNGLIEVPLIFILFSMILPLVCLFYKEKWDDNLLDALKKRSTDVFWKEHDRWNLNVKITTGDITEGMSMNKEYEDFLKRHNENLK